jgi:TonB-linked SusC/RagA family outer membrane protein
MTNKFFDLRAVLIALFATVAMSMAAGTPVKGVVFDSSGEPVIGATVRVDGEKNAGTATDLDGNFVLEVPSTNATLVVSYVGMSTQKVKLAGRSNVTVKMANNDINLNEVVVVGYGTAKRVDITGSVASLTAEQMKQSIVTNADQMLQGKVAGVQVTQNTGAPGGATSIRIRGASSINNSNEPLYVIDGIQMSGAASSIGGFDWAGGTNGQSNVANPLAAIAPSDIVSIDVLKDASATAIYGAAGANGVVIVTTRRGKAGITNVTYDGYVAWQQTAKRLDMLDLPGYAQYQKDLLTEGVGFTLNDAYKDPTILGKGTDWQDEIFRTAFMQSHQVSITGGNDKATFAASGGWMNQDGIIIGSDFSRFNSRFSVDAQLTPWLKMGGQLAYTYTNEKITRNDGSDGIIMQALTMQPDVPVYDFDGKFAGPSTTAGSSTWNPVCLALQTNNKLYRHRIMGNFYASIDFLKHFNLRVEYGYDGSNNTNKSYIPRYTFGVVSNNINKIYQKEDHSNYWNQKDYITYHQTFAKVHDVQFMAGFEASASNWENTTLIKNNMSSDVIQNIITSDGTFVSNSGQKDKATTASVFGRLNYGFDNRYLLTATLRADGSSKFGEDNTWGYFPSCALAWRISEEKFMKNVSWINNLKLRFGYGQVGNSNIGTYLYGSAMREVTTPMGTAYIPKNISNPKLKWEASEQWNAGVDFAAFNNRLELTVDVYNKHTKDLLLQVLIPTYLGGYNWDNIQAPYANIGKTENKGIDVSVNTRNVMTKDFQWRTNITFSHNKNKVTALNDNSQVIYGKVDWYSEFQTATMIEVGQPMGVFYGYEVDRVFKDKDDILSSPVQVSDGGTPAKNVVGQTTGVWPGDLKFKDLNGDGVINTKDQTVIGDPNPDFTFGFTNTFTYKAWELNIGVTGSVGGDILNWVRYKTEGLVSLWDNQAATVSGRAHYGYRDGNSANQSADNVYIINTDASIPRFSTLDMNRNNRMSDRWIEDGTYVRIQNVALTYNLPPFLTHKIGMASGKIYFNVQNLYTFTGYSGYDPEIGSYNQSALLQNIDRGRYPTPRTYTIGLNLSF